MSRSHLTLLGVVVPALLVLAAASVPAADKDWIELTGKDFDAWKSGGKDWLLADTVEVDAKNPKLLTAKPGTGIIVNGPMGRAPDLYTKTDFGDLEVHLEFFIPKGSNSGVKFHGHYEIQILDSFGVKEVDGSHCGGIYPRAADKPVYNYIDKGVPPKVNACKEPGTWQTLDVIFVAPRFDSAGKKTANAKIVKAVFNDKLIHENQDMLTPTGGNHLKPEMAKGPLMLQGNHGPVAFRNVRVRPYTPEPK